MKIKEILKYILTLIILISTEIVILTSVNIIPRKYIETNVKESSEILNKEGLFPQLGNVYVFILDNWTDAVMINTAYSVDYNKPFESAILMRRNYRTSADIIIEKKDNEENPILNLYETIEGKNEIYYEYSRYWHGYMAYLRPLLTVFNYAQIRVLFSVIIICLSLLLVYIVYKKINIHTSIITLVVLFLGNFYYIGLSLQYFSTFTIMLVSSIYIIMNYKKIDIYQCFFVIGCVTCFFDLLTAPLLTCGIPILYYTILRQIKSESMDPKETIKILSLWFLGYGLMWMCKWVISDLVLDTGTIQRAIEKISLLTNNDNSINTSAIESIKRNIEMIGTKFLAILSTLSIISCIINKKSLKNKISYLIVIILPFIWYLLIKNHSYIHARFTFRNLIISILGLAILLTENVIDYINDKK